MNATDAGSVRDPMTASPRMRDDLVVTPDISNVTPSYVIEDPLRGKFYRVGVPEFTFMSLLDGRASIAAALGTAAGQLGRRALAEHEALALCHWLLDSQLAHTDDSAQADRLCESAEKIAQRRLAGNINPLMIKVPLVNPDGLLEAIGPWVAWLFSWQFFLVWIGACSYGVYLVAAGWDHRAASAGVILDRDNWLRLAMAWALLKVLHELAHGLACKKYGGTVPEAGVTFLFLAPLAYVDVTSSWRFRCKWHRMATAGAGMYVELFAAAIAVICWSNTSAGLAHHFALNVAVMASFNTLLFNGNPLVRFDGYFIFSDLLGIPNLYSCSQQCLVAAMQKYLLGLQPPTTSLPRRKLAMVQIYGAAALAWRVACFLSLALLLLGMFSHFGVLLAAVLLALAWGVPGIRIARQLVQNRSRQPVNKRRLAVSVGACLSLAAVASLLLVHPGTVKAPAVVEYSPLTVIRAATPGFVREIRVRSGDVVEPGQVIAVLENEELLAELADLQLAFQQSVLRERTCHLEAQLGKSQAERANQEALEKKIAEMRDRIAGLTVRTPVGGHAFEPDIDSLEGRYLQTGGVIAFVGTEQTKELLIAVDQDDIDLFLCQLGRAVDVRTRLSGGTWLAARLTQAEPRGSVELPHPAFAAPVGGPLAVRPNRESQRSSENEGGNYELLTPVFLVKAELPPEQSLQLHAGQLATVTFRSPTETVASRIVSRTQAWIQRQIAAGRAK